MKTIFFCGYVAAALMLPLYGGLPVKLSVKTLGDKALMQRQITLVIENYREPLQQVRSALQSNLATAQSDQKPVVQKSLKALATILDDGDISRASDLLLLVHLLHNAGEKAEILGDIEPGPIAGTLNYLLDSIYMAQLRGEEANLSDDSLDAMIQFYSANATQTSELSWLAPNNILFVLGNRVVERLGQHFPDRIAAFCEDVRHARKYNASGPGSDEGSIEALERPSAAQLARYEAAFAKLESLAKRSAATPATSSSDPSKRGKTEAPPTEQPEPPSNSLPASASAPGVDPTASSANSTSNSLACAWVAAIVASISLLLLWLRRRK